MRNSHFRRRWGLVLNLASGFICAALPGIAGGPPITISEPLASVLEHIASWDCTGETKASVQARDLGPAAAAELVQIIEHPATSNLRVAAYKALAAMGPNAAPALPVLTNILFASGSDSTAAVALAKIGPRGSLYLAIALTNANPLVRGAAAYGMGWDQTGNEQAVRGLILRLEDPEGFVRMHAANSLGKIHAHPEIAVPALLKALKSSDTPIAAIHALGQFGASARIAVPALVEALEDPGLALAASNALRKIDVEWQSSHTYR